MRHSTAQLFLFCRSDKGCDGKIELYRVFLAVVKIWWKLLIDWFKGVKFEPLEKLMLPGK